LLQNVPHRVRYTIWNAVQAPARISAELDEFASLVLHRRSARHVDSRRLGAGFSVQADTDRRAVFCGRPGQVTMGSAGNGGTLHLALEMLNKEAATNMIHVPYKGAAPAVVDVVAGQLSGMFVDLPVVSPYIKAGRVKALAVASPKRSAYFPEVPTTKEAGYSNVELRNYYALLLPAKTPRDVVGKLHDSVVKTVNTPGVREKLISFGADPLTMTPDEFTRFLRADIEMWGKVVKAAGVKIN